MMNGHFLSAILTSMAVVISCILASADLMAQTRLFVFPSEEEKVLSAEQLNNTVHLKHKIHMNMLS